MVPRRVTANRGRPVREAVRGDLYETRDYVGRVLDAQKRYRVQYRRELGL